jgi:hypothetical protein
MISYLAIAAIKLQKRWRSKFSKKLRIRIPPHKDYELDSGERAPKASLKIY